MAMKFRRVKRRSRRRHARRNPASKLLMWGAIGLGGYLLMKKMQATAAAKAIATPASAALLTAQIAPKPSAADPAMLATAGLGGIFGTAKGYGSLS